MRGIAGKQTRGLPTMARLQVADNTGAKVAQIINVRKLGGTMRRYPAAGVALARLLFSDSTSLAQQGYPPRSLKTTRSSLKDDHPVPSRSCSPLCRGSPHQAWRIGYRQR